MRVRTLDPQALNGKALDIWRIETKLEVLFQEVPRFGSWSLESRMQGLGFIGSQP